MNGRERELIAVLEREHRLSEAEYAELIRGRDEEAAALLAERASAGSAGTTVRRNGTA